MLRRLCLSFLTISAPSMITVEGFPTIPLSLCKKYRATTELYLFHRKEKISIRPLKGEENGLNQIRVQKSVIQGECNSTRYICCTQREASWLSICEWVSLSKDYLLKGKGGVFFISVLVKDWAFVPTYPHIETRN